MNPKRIAVLFIALLLIAIGGARVSAQGEITLESLAQQVHNLLDRVDATEKTDKRLELRIQALEERVARLEPTATPTSTPTPVGRASPVPTPNLKEQTLFDNHVLELFLGSEEGQEGLLSAWEKLARLFFNLGEKPSLIFEDEWTEEVVKVAEMFNATYALAQEYESPISMKEENAKLLEGLRLCSLGARDLIEGVQKYSDEKIEGGSELLNQCSLILFEEPDE